MGSIIPYTTQPTRVLFIAHLTQVRFIMKSPPHHSAATANFLMTQNDNCNNSLIDINSSCLSVALQVANKSHIEKTTIIFKIAMWGYVSSLEGITKQITNHYPPCCSCKSVLKRLMTVWQSVIFFLVEDPWKREWKMVGWLLVRAHDTHTRKKQNVLWFNGIPTNHFWSNIVRSLKSVQWLPKCWVLLSHHDVAFINPI